MDDRRALMATCIANPDEDTPRLVLADWLQEHGDKYDQARAEFIRLQIQAENLPEGDTIRKKMEAAAKKLEKKHHVKWLAPITKAEAKLVNTNRPFARGLLQSLWFPTSTFLKKSCQQAIPDALASVGVHELGFYSAANKRIKELAASTAFRWCTGVSYPGADDGSLYAIGDSENFAHISSLSLDNMHVTDAGLKSFAANSVTVRLRKIGLGAYGGGQYTVAGVLAILNSQRFPRLDSLDLIDYQPVDWSRLFSNSGLQKLVALRLGFYFPMIALTTCKHLMNLRELVIETATITDDDVDALLNNPVFSNLSKVRMSKMNWGGDRLSQPMEKRLRERFGANVLEY